MTTVAPAPAATGRVPLPGVVLLACWLLGGVAAVRAVAAIAAFYAMPEAGWHYAEAAADEDSAAVGVAGLGLFGGFSILMAVVYLALALLDAAGFNAARIVTWVVAGLTICAGAPALVVNLYAPIVWYDRLTTAATAATMALSIMVIVLLALPASNQFYRSRRRPRPPAAPVAPYGPGWPPSPQPPYGPPPAPLSPPAPPPK